MFFSTVYGTTGDIWKVTGLSPEDCKMNDLVLCEIPGF